MPDPIDISVGSRIRFYRKSRHVSQMELAKRIGVTFQQVQKYENGKNRVSPSRLQMISEALRQMISEALRTHIQHFFADDGSDRTSPASPGNARRDVIDLVTAYLEIRDPHVRSTVMTLIESLGADRQAIALRRAAGTESSC